MIEQKLSFSATIATMATLFKNKPTIEIQIAESLTLKITRKP